MVWWLRVIMSSINQKKICVALHGKINLNIVWRSWVAIRPWNLFLFSECNFRFMVVNRLSLPCNHCSLVTAFIQFCSHFHQICYSCCKTVKKWNRNWENMRNNRILLLKFNGFCFASVSGSKPFFLIPLFIIFIKSWWILQLMRNLPGPDNTKVLTLKVLSSLCQQALFFQWPAKVWLAFFHYYNIPNKRRVVWEIVFNKILVNEIILLFFSRTERLTSRSSE